MSRILYVLCVLLLLTVSSFAQTTVQQGGNVTFGHAAVWAAPGIIRDAGTSTGTSYLSSLGLTSDGGTPLCISSGVSSLAAYNKFCLGVDLTTGAYLSDTSYGTATHRPMYFTVNGTNVLSLGDTAATFAYAPIIPLTGYLYGNGTGAITASSTIPYAAIPTATTILDNIGATQGSVLYRGSTSWTALTPGVSGQVLTSSGVAANPSWTTVAGTGTVQSAAMTGDGTVFNSTVTGSPVTNTGTLAPTLKTQTANYVLAGPTSGSATAPTFRALIAADLAIGSGTLTAATTTDLGSITQSILTVTGNTTIAGLGTTTAGTCKVVQFAGHPTITNGVSLVLPGAADYTTVAGDVFTFCTSGSGNWYTDSYALISGRSITANANVAGNPPAAGNYSRLKGIAASSTTATWTANGIVVKTALGGIPYLLSSYNQTLNIATTGAGGMDTGSAPTSNYLYIYAIYNPTTNTQSILGQANSGTGAGNMVYGGANMPSGYTASALIGVVLMNASSQFIGFVQHDNAVYFVNRAIITSGGDTVYTTVSLAPGAPPIARTISGYVQTLENGAVATLSVDSTGIGQRLFGVTNNTFYVEYVNFPVYTASTIYYRTTGLINVTVNAYTF